MKDFLTRIVTRVLQKFVRSSGDYVYIEGGLGSQILSFMQYKILLETNPRAKLDARYFHITASQKAKVWKWELGEYGYSLPQMEEGLRAKIRYLGRDSRARASKDNLAIWKGISTKGFHDLFPLHNSTSVLMKQLNISQIENFAAIHIRRGDYLTVSSKLVAVDEYLKVVRSFSLKFTGRVLVFSDDPFSDSDQMRIKSVCQGEVTFITGLDQHGVHGLMRCASTLVTSNSTFSLTAALLSENKNPTIIAPTLFFSEENRDVNLLIQQLSSWMLIEKGSHESKE
jgi:hypothetical protein